MKKFSWIFWIFTLMVGLAFATSGAIAEEKKPYTYEGSFDPIIINTWPIVGMEMSSNVEGMYFALHKCPYSSGTLQYVLVKVMYLPDDDVMGLVPKVVGWAYYVDDELFIFQVTEETLKSENAWHYARNKDPSKEDIDGINQWIEKLKPPAEGQGGIDENTK